MSQEGFDLSKFKSLNDTDKEWQLKKLFMQTYYNRFDEARLVCLAQCYSNIEIYGCV